MNVPRNEKGYALITVLLIMFIFISLGAVFMAASLNHMKQEQAVDGSNQAVAAAEMGVLHYKSDFQMELEGVEKEVAAFTQAKLNELVVCITQAQETCNTETKRLSEENRIDKEARELYLEKIAQKIESFADITNSSPIYKETPFADVGYWLQTVGGTAVSPTDDDLEEISVDIGIRGESSSRTKDLATTFNLTVPESFLDRDNAQEVPITVVSEDEDIQYTEIFNLSRPADSCAVLLEKVKKGEAVSPYSCKSQSGEKLKNFVSDIQAAGLDPKDFRVYADDYKAYVCEANCNNIDFYEVTVVVDQAEVERNMQNMTNANVMVDGKLSIGGNAMNMGRNGIQQTIVVKELEIGIHLKNMYYTNLLVTGYENRNDAALKIGTHNGSGQLVVGKYSKMCVDIDRIKPTDITALEEQIQFDDNGALHYYSGLGKTLNLKDKKGNSRNLDAHVVAYDSYTAFLQSCGVSLTEKKVETTEVSVPNIINSGFEYDVIY